MMTRISAALLISSALVTTACAQETTTPEVLSNVAEPVISAAATAFEAPESAWRTVEQENLLYIDTVYGQVLVEMFPEISPKHVAQIKALAASEFYDNITFHRVIDGFMNQTGDPTGTGMGDSDLADIEAEFTFRRDPAMKVTLLDKRPVDLQAKSDRAVDVGFYHGLPVATQPAMQAALTIDGKVDAWALHCLGVASMARAQAPNSANSQFFLMRGEANFLDTKYSIWGNTVYGEPVLTQIKIGTKGETPNFVPDQMQKVRVGSDLPAAEQKAVQVLKTDSASFKAHLATQKTADGRYPDICEINVPSRLKP